MCRFVNCSFDPEPVATASCRLLTYHQPEAPGLKLRLFAGRVSRPVDFDTFLVGPGDPTYGMHGEFDFAQLQNLRFGFVFEGYHR